MKVTVKRANDFKWIVGHTFNVLKETEDNKGYYIILPVGCCRIEKDDVERV